MIEEEKDEEKKKGFIDLFVNAAKGDKDQSAEEANDSNADKANADDNVIGRSD